MTSLNYRILLVPLLPATAIGAICAQAPAVSPSALVDRAGHYVEEYDKAFSALVCEERQIQSLVWPDGRTEKKRELVSDFLLVNVGTERMLAFRDVLDVDGKPVRNRQERLRKLFIETPRTALKQAEAIARESGRYNIGVSRTPNSPLLPLQVLQPRNAPGFRFALAPGGLAFEEIRSPSLVRHKDGGKTDDMLSRGSCVVDPETGRVLAATLAAGGAATRFNATFHVRYVEEPTLKLLVPVEMREEIWRPASPRHSRLVVVSSYANFRRFQVATNEEIRVPK